MRYATPLDMQIPDHKAAGPCRWTRPAGFTLLELVIAILILGVLAATALPRFMDSRVQAHEAKVKAVGGAFATAVQMVHAQWQANGANATAVDNLPGFGEDNIDVNANGWPTDTNGANQIPLFNAGRNQCRRLLQTLLLNGPSVSQVAPGPGLLISSAYAFSAPPYDPAADFWASAPALNRCSFEYRPIANLGFTYDCLNGTVVVDDDASS